MPETQTYPHPLVQLMIYSYDLEMNRDAHIPALQPNESDTPVVAKLRRLCGVKHRAGLIDSSGVFGNIAERFLNFDERLDEPMMTLDSVFGYPVVHIIPYFKKFLEVTEESEELQQRLNQFDRENDDEGTMIHDGHREWLEKNFGEEYAKMTVGYTYNDDNAFDRDFQYLVCESVSTGKALIAISLHTGCDARWGFTHYECFSIRGDWFDGCVGYLLNPDVTFDLADGSPDLRDKSWESVYGLENEEGVWDKEQQKWFFQGREVEVWLHDDWAWQS